MSDYVGAAVRSRKSSEKVVSIAAGEAHTLALTGEGEVYAWGRGTLGRLGTGSEDDRLFPVRVEFEAAGRRKFVEVAAGAYHSLALSEDGSVWSWGYNIFGRFDPWLTHNISLILDSFMDGQLGINGDYALVPQLLDKFLDLDSPDSSTVLSAATSSTGLKVSTIKAGGMMSLAIDNQGALWMWGNCPPQTTSAEAEFSLSSSPIPTPVWHFHGHTVVKVACGNEHVVALVTAGETYTGGGDLVCYSWGSNNHGQLGLGDTESRSQPKIVEKFSHGSLWGVYSVACGAFHTAILALDNRSNDVTRSICFTFGLGDKGQLGHGTTKNALSPDFVKNLPENVFILSVDCGLFHTSVVSSAGDVWSWGMEKGLGLCPDASFTGTDPGDALLPLVITCNGAYMPKFDGAVQVTCGAAHTVLIADDGFKVYSWGRGRSGVLGDGKTTDCFAPTLVLWPPLSEDFKETEIKKSKGKERKEVVETEEKLSEMESLKSKLLVMEKYASILHGSIFGKPFEKERDIPMSLYNEDGFDIAKKWENMLESSDRGKLIRLEMFYRNMVASVKDKLLKKRVEEIIKDCLNSSGRGNN